MIASPPPFPLLAEPGARAAGRRARTAGRLLPLAVVAAVLGAGLDSPSGGTHPDERLYLSLANEMQVHSGWMTPRLEGQPDYTKPPLLYWASGACLFLLGQHLWAARLPVALSAFFLALLAGRLARRFGGEAAFGRGVLLVGTSLGVLRYGRLTMMDVPLALALAVGVEAAWAAATERRPRLLLVVGLAAGCSALLKGPVGPLLVFSIAAVLLAVRAPALLRSLWALASVALALAVSAPWFVAMTERHGKPFLERIILVENFGKFGVPWTLGAEVWLLTVLLLLALPWVALVQWKAAPPGLRLLSGTWVAVVLLVFSLPGLKQSHYVVPCLVPLLLLAAVPEQPLRMSARTTAALLAVVAAVAALALRVSFPWAVRFGLLGMVVLLGLSALALLRLRPEAAAVGFGGASVLALSVVLPTLNPPPVSEAAWAAAGERPVVIWRQDPGLYELLARRKVHRVNDAEETRSAVAQGAAAVLPFQDFAALPPQVQAGLEPLMHWARLRPRLTAGDVLQALWAGNPVPLQEEALLVVRTPPAPPSLGPQGR
jgi:4-amino-4-deoxy-L-arabinose transferase-like glycosyltransferase